MPKLLIRVYKRCKETYAPPLSIMTNLISVVVSNHEQGLVWLRGIDLGGNLVFVSPDLADPTCLVVRTAFPSKNIGIADCCNRNILAYCEGDTRLCLSSQVLAITSADLDVADSKKVLLQFEWVEDVPSHFIANERWRLVFDRANMLARELLCAV